MPKLRAVSQGREVNPNYIRGEVMTVGTGGAGRRSWAARALGRFSLPVDARRLIADNKA